MQLLRILRAHVGLIALTVIVAWTVAAALTVAATPKYVATSSVMVDFADRTAIAGKPPIQLYAGYLATQIDLLASQTVALKVVDQLRLAEDEATRRLYLGAPSSLQEVAARIKSGVQALVARMTRSTEPTLAQDNRDIRFRLADQVLKHTAIRPSPDSSVIQVTYAATSPQAAAAAANAIVRAYIDTTLEINVNPARSSSEWLDAQVKRLTDDLHAARGKLAEFQQRTGIVDGSESNDVETVRLNDLNSQLVAAQAQNHPAIQALKSELARAQAKLNELPPQMGPNHPTYASAQREVAALRSQLEDESARLAMGLRGEISQQRGSMLQMKRQHGQLATFQDGVDSAQRALDDAMEKANQARMDSQITQTNVSVIRVAVPPQHPTTPNPLFNFALATAIGLALGAGFGLWREVVCRFVRSTDDIRDFLGVQVLGVLHAGPRSSSGRGRLTQPPQLLTAEH